MIRKKGNKYILFTSDGKRKLSEFPSKLKAVKRERQIQFFKWKSSQGK